ncbi:hypothetical protein [Halomarina oriensis]|uniref:Uncharacterized protein n=1 Tax=Halomarina oriensis TaxID=671145 RepID=A0A6B0GLI0_9EURY|nr:hypothetical protein [Halomarina oriensis]MWG32975.1 hypothetical protein [Halomarina oriensis]
MSVNDVLADWTGWDDLADHEQATLEAAQASVALQKALLAELGGDPDALGIDLESTATVTLPGDGGAAPDPLPHEVVDVPADADALALPAGETTLVTRTGMVQHDSGVLGSFTGTQTLTEASSRTFEGFRSVAVSPDDVVTVQAGDREPVRVRPGDTVTLAGWDMERVRIDAERPCRAVVALGTRADSIDGALGTLSLARSGTGGGAGTYGAVLLGPGDVDGAQTVRTADCERVSIIANNDSGSAADVRVTACDDVNGAGTFYPIVEVTGLADGDHHVFELATAHRFLKVDATQDVDVTLSGVTR